MKYFSFLLLTFLFACNATAREKQTTMIPTPATEAVKAVITEFVAAGDAQDTARLEAVLNDNYRIAVNQFMGKPGVTIINRSTYLSMIEAKKLGGTPRTLTFGTIEVVGNIAFVRVTLESDKLTFQTMYTLAQDKLGDWTLVSDSPYTTPKA